MIEDAWRERLGRPEGAAKEDPRADQPADSTDLDGWMEKLEQLTDELLQDRDCEDGVLYSDENSAVADELKRGMGIKQDYFAAAPPALTPKVKARLDRLYREIVRESNLDGAQDDVRRRRNMVGSRSLSRRTERGRLTREVRKVIVLVAAAHLASCAGSDRAPEGPGPAEIRRWVEELGSDDPSSRDRAEERLMAAGPVALEILEPETASQDPEVRVRASRIVEALRAVRATEEADRAAWEKAFGLSPSRDVITADSAGIVRLPGVRLQVRRLASPTSPEDAILEILHDYNGSGEVVIAPLEFTDARGDPIRHEGCGKCSPRLFLLRDAGEGSVRARLMVKLRVRVRYKLSYVEPKAGDVVRAGPLSFELLPDMRVSTRSAVALNEEDFAR